MAGNGVPGRLDFTGKQGDTFNSGPMQWIRGGTIVNGEVVGGTPVDLSGAIGTCELKSTTTSGVIASLSVVIDDAVSSKFHIEASAATMSSIPAAGPTVNDYTQYQQDIRFSWPSSSGYSETITQGIFYLIPEVSKQ